MSKYTISIQELLYANKGDDDPTTLEGIHDIAERVLFGNEINVINDDYVDQFITGFALHYYYDEIGRVPYQAWRISIMEKIINNADLINAVYENLDKQLFADYRVHTVSNTTNKIDALTTAGHSDTTSANAGTSAKSNTGTTTDAHTGTTGTSEAGTDSLVKGGSDTTSHGISEVHGKSGTDSTTHTGTDTTSHTGSETDATSGSEIYDKSGSAERTVAGTTATSGGETLNETNNVDHSESGSYRDTTVYGKTDTTNTSTDNNGMTIQFDTPMGSVENLKTPNDSTRGMGVAAVASQNTSGQPITGAHTYNYMTAAQEDDNSSVGQTTVVGSGNDYTEHTVNGYKTDDDTTIASVKQTGNLSQEDSQTSDSNSESSSKATASSATKIHDTADETQYDSSESTSYGTTETHSAAASDETQYGGTEERGSTRSATQVFDDAHTRTDDLSEETATASSGSVSTVNGSSTSGTSDVTSEMTEEDKHFNYEMFMKADLMMSKIWDIFDPCFFMLLDAF